MKFQIIRRCGSALFASALLTVAVGCSNSKDVVERKSETTEISGDSKMKTTTESTQVGSNLETTTTTKVDGDRKLTTEEFIGTVTVFNPGKSIEVMTGEKKTNSFDLDEKNQVARVDSSVVVGSRVRLTREKTSDGNVRISVVAERS